MTYVEIILALADRNCEAAIRALSNAMREEGCALIEGTANYGAYDNQRFQRLRIPNKKAEAAAEDFYAEDITSLLRVYEDPSPSRLLNHRRFAVAWAVAEVLRTCDKPFKCCVKCSNAINKPVLSAHESERCESCAEPE